MQSNLSITRNIKEPLYNRFMWRTHCLQSVRAITVRHVQQSVRFTACRRPAARGATKHRAKNARPPIHAAKCKPARRFRFFPHLSKVFFSLNFLTAHSCSQKPSSDKLYVCVEFSTKTDAVMLNFYQWCKTPSSAFSKKNFQRRPPIFCTFSVEPLVIYNCALYIENSRTFCEIFDF